MKLKKYSYLLIFILMLMIGIQTVYGATEATSTITCDALFGSGPNSLRQLINDILQYPRIIVPVIIIVFGMIDIAKAVFASKEDEMRKAQTTFIKRVFIGVVVFLVPTIVDVIMYMADIVWAELGYTKCDLNSIINLTNMIK